MENKTLSSLMNDLIGVCQYGTFVMIPVDIHIRLLALEQLEAIVIYKIKNGNQDEIDELIFGEKGIVNKFKIALDMGLYSDVKCRLIQVLGQICILIGENNKTSALNEILPALLEKLADTNKSVSNTAAETLALIINTVLSKEITLEQRICLLSELPESSMTHLLSLLEDMQRSRTIDNQTASAIRKINEALKRREQDKGNRAQGHRTN